MKLRALLIWAAVMAVAYPCLAGDVELQWVQSPRERLFVREQPRCLTLRIINQTDQPLTAPKLVIARRDHLYQRELKSLAITVDGSITPGESRDVVVDLTIRSAGEFDVTASTAGAVQVTTQLTSILGPQPPDFEGPVPFFGGSSHGAYDKEDWETRREFGMRAERGWVVKWDDVQLEPGHLDPQRIARVHQFIDNAEAVGSQVWAFTGYVPPYARTPEAQAYVSNNDEGTFFTPPLPYYTEFLDLAGREFRDSMDYWEIWNEPATFLKGSIEDLADLHKAAALTLRRVNPHAKIIGATIIGPDMDLLNRLLDAGAIDYADIIAFHNYVWAYPPDSAARSTLQAVIAWRDKHAPGRPLWDDEASPTQYDKIEEPIWAGLTARHLIIARAYGMQNASYYNWAGTATQLSVDGRPNLAAIAYRTTAQHLTNARPVTAIAEDRDGAYAYVFEQNGVGVLVAWTTQEADGQALRDVIVGSSDAKLYDIAGNELPLDIVRDRFDLSLTRWPQFLVGISPEYVKSGRRLSPSPDDGPPARHPDLFLSFHYPYGSTVQPLMRGRPTTIELQVHNLSGQPHEGELTLEPDSSGLHVASKKIKVQVAAHEVATIPVELTASPAAKEGLHRVEVTSTADGQSFGRMNLRCWVADELVRQFEMATWEMHEQMIAGDNMGQGNGMRWLNPQGYLTFRFDLSDAARARLEMLCDSVSPSNVDGGNIRVVASKDQENWQPLLETRGGLDWRTVNLDAFAGSVVYVRLENPSDKGQARYSTMRLITTPAQ